MSEKFDVIIGLEIHIQSKTESKMFCSCSAQYFQKEANTNVCPVCIGLPGALPIPNKRAIENCIKLGLATESTISKNLRFDRKHYFYPDLPKGYQISQYDMPLCSNGRLTIFDKEGNAKEIEIERIHQEEDVAKSTRGVESDGKEYTAIDYNKSGVPLIELVTKPVLTSPSDAKNFATAIRQLVRWLGISDADMEKGQMRCEPNISVQEKGKWKVDEGKVLPIGDYILNPKVEVKNIGSITAVEKAVAYEVERMIEEIESGKKLTQQTRGWDPVGNVTVFQRSKESAQDYRYFPDPDIPLIEIEESDITRLKSEIPELPSTLYAKYTEEYKLSHYDASVLIADKETSDFATDSMNNLRESFKFTPEESAKTVSNWITGPMFALSNELSTGVSQIGITSGGLTQLIQAEKEGKLPLSKARELLAVSVKEKKPIEELLNNLGKVVSDSSQIESIASEVLENNEKAVADFKSGKESVIMFLVGQLMKETKGMVNPNTAKEILLKLLKQ